MKTTWILVAGFLLATFIGCGGEEETAAATEESSEAEPAEAPSEPAEAPSEREACTVDAEAGAVAEDPTFELRATATGPYTAGERGTFAIVLTPRGGYHVNQGFPTSVRPCAGDGVTLPNAELGNDDAAERTEQRARFLVPFTASEAGEHRVSAVVDFAVCTPETCMPDQRTVAVLLPVQ